MSLFISDAIAQAAPVSQPMAAHNDSTFSFLMIGAIFVLFYFMLIRPQNKKAKEHRALIQNLKVGDEIVTSGGMLAKVASLQEQYMKVKLADGVEITIQRNAVNTVLPKGTIKSV